ncbi:hypothetical protein EV699_105179 [Plasticicumulans lactativorans]|uniref:AMMECR1 domain-containing protein n=1 Tax=Plasticicumulans lactativorans TaxID=1133106 RepID=A0A4R2LH76_9GAMM|nr:AmmeMemoRadiSam system protein A [Plasticicumulans lactativorans]TCO82388.1 hypothetical protein EV699_105179 [Plasticicumulans lactativorans]
MAPTPSSPEHLGAGERRALLGVARAAIAHALAHGRRLAVDVAAFPPRLREPGASFVTLEIDGHLRGCIGTLEARVPLVRDVATHAHAAAFEDPRFPPLTAAEWPRVELHVSVLTPPEPLPAGSEAELLAQLRPGVDGLILEAPGHRATFLPAVWEDLPAPAEFLGHLKRKAGLPAAYWSPELRFARYTTEAFGDDPAAS